jgi:hypothetical protein
VEWRGRHPNARFWNEHHTPHATPVPASPSSEDCFNYCSSRRPKHTHTHTHTAHAGNAPQHATTCSRVMQDKIQMIQRKTPEARCRVTTTNTQRHIYTHNMQQGNARQDTDDSRKTPETPCRNRTQYSLYRRLKELQHRK